MSYNLAFWKGHAVADADAEGVYLALSSGEVVSGIPDVDAAALDRALRDGLAGWTWESGVLTPPESVDAGPRFEVTVGTQFVEFVGHGVDGEYLNAVIDAMRPFGFRLFDPQTGERFD
ncbi:hypothetical protein [Gordonia zhaorongruii]|uniref:hypothetical protein n=1 Tax=Gordonia zhaorongruii TaxID=2597659 RepID=UPI00104B8B83|nr:hypothetical protein [Gordonia zhaorongruii]